MIDLHIHTACSDGTWTINETLEEARKADLTAIAITDHNTVSGCYEIENKETEFSYKGKIVRGVEIDCIAFNSKIELLGYDFENLDMLNEWLKENYSQEKNKLFRKGEYDRLLAKMNEHGVTHSCNPIYENQEYLPHTAIYKEMKKHEENRRLVSEKEWNDFSVFFRTATTNPKSLFFIDYTGLLPSASEVSEIVRKAKGKVFLAHVYQYGMENHLQFIEKLRENNIIDGIEVHYVEFSDEQKKTLSDYCNKHGLFMSGGSDTHGDKGNRKIGIGCGNLNVPENILNEWFLS